MAIFMLLNTFIASHMAVSLFMILMGLSMAVIWFRDIIKGKFSGKGKFFSWREGENMLWPHILVEYLTAAGLIAGGIGLLLTKNWAYEVSLVAFGALIYAAINSTGWVLARKERIAYGIPMWLGLGMAIIALFILI